MPIVAMPNGQQVNFPDTMDKEQIKAAILSKFPELSQQAAPTVEDAPSPQIGAAEAAFEGIGSGVTLGFGDELRAALAARVGSLSPELTYKEAYPQALDIFRQKQKQAAEQQPWAYYPAEIVGGMGTGGVAASRIGGKALAKQFAKKPIRTGATAGAVSGGIYGTGASEGEIPERLAAGGQAAALGLGAGTIGSYIAPKVAAGVGKLFKGSPPTTPTGALDEMVEEAAARELAPTTSFRSESLAQEKVIKALKADYPDNWKDILEAWKTSGKPLAEIGGSRVSTLAKGAAQYPSGQAVAGRYFAEEIGEMPERIKDAISKNISSVDTYYLTAEDLVKAGQKRAAPLYRRAFKVDAIDDEAINTILATPELKKAIGEGVKIEKLNAAADGLAFNPAKYAVDETGELLGRVPSMELLDAGKKGLDALIEKEIDTLTGKTTQYGKALIKLQKSYLRNLDRVNPFYKQARAEAGDYLGVKAAMDEGRKFMKLDYELIAKKFKAMSPKERQAYKIGVGKQLRDLIDSPTGGVRNPYDKVFRGIAQQKKLANILSPTEYKNFEKAIKAEDRLFKMKNEVIGGSPTASKQIAAQEIAAGGADLAGVLATGDISGAGAGAVRGLVRKVFDGLSDNSADAVARLLFEKDAPKRLRLLEATLGRKNMSAPDKRLLKEAYFTISDAIKGQQQSAVASGIAAGQLTKDEEK